MLFFLSTMKRCCCSFFLPFLLLFILFAAVPVSSAVKYHGKNRFWTVVDEAGKTYLDLRQFSGNDAKLIFPKQYKLPEIGTFTTSNKNCQNDLAHKLEFNLAVIPGYYLRGELGVDKVRNETYGFVSAFMFERCTLSGRNILETETPAAVINFELNELITTPKCFGMVAVVPFLLLDGDPTKMSMNFAVKNGVFDCPAFFVLDKDTTITDVAPFQVSWIPLNESYYPGESENWWKTSNNETLPDGATFDAYHNPVFDVLKMVESVPYFIRYGSNQPIPTFQFKLRTTCVNSSFDIQFNDDDCKLTVNMVDKGFTLKTKQGETPFIEAKLFFSLVFDSESEAVYIKTLEPAISITRWSSCKVGMDSSAPDTMAIRVSNVKDVSTCDGLEFFLLKDDVNAGIQMLVNTTKIDELSAPPVDADQASGDSHQQATTSDPDTASASLEWWWIVVPVLILLLIAGAIAVGVIVCIRRRRAKQKKLMEANYRPKSPVRDPTISKAKAPVEKDATSKRKKKGKTKNEEKEFSIIQGFYPPPNPETKVPKVKPGLVEAVNEEKSRPDPSFDVQTTQMATVDEKAALVSNQSNPSNPPATPLLKYRSMYLNGDSQTKEPYDYHAGESPTFEASSTLAVLENLDLKTYQNFWSCVEGISPFKRDTPVYGNESDKEAGENVWFIFRDLVADEDSSNAPFRSLANRMLEPLKNDFAPGKDVTETTVDGRKKYFLVRIFVISYDPFTMELHCRGQCPSFIFSLFECEKCQIFLKQFQKNAWLDSASCCIYDWSSFVCRVKRTILNGHQFLSYNGESPPKNSEEVNHILIIRGDMERNEFRQCIKGCNFSEGRNHPNEPKKKSSDE